MTIEKTGEPAVLKVGDCIECHDKDEVAEMSMELGKAGIQTEFVYEMNGEEGLWLVVEEIESGTN